MPEHEDIVGGVNIHEEKHISDATTGDAGKVVTPSSTTNGEGELRNLKISEIDTTTERSPQTGWEFSQDGTYTSGSPLAVLTGVRTQIPIDGLGSAASDLPLSITNLWNTSTNKIVLPQETDLLHFRLSCSITTLATSAYVDLEVDIGGATGVIFDVNKVLTKVSPSVNKITFSATIYGDSVMLANGAALYITPSADISLFDQRILVSKLHHGGI